MLINMTIFTLVGIIFGGLLILAVLYGVLNNNTPEDYVSTYTKKGKTATPKKKSHTHNKPPYSDTPSYPDPSAMNSQTSGSEWHIYDEDDPFGTDEDAFDAYYRRQGKKDSKK